MTFVEPQRVILWIRFDSMPAMPLQAFEHLNTAPFSSLGLRKSGTRHQSKELSRGRGRSVWISVGRLWISRHIMPGPAFGKLDRLL